MLGKSFSLLHIDDEALWYHLLESALARTGLVGSRWHAATAAAGLSAVARHKPDLIVLELNLPDAVGFDLSRQLAAAPQPPRILLLTVRKDDVALHLSGQSNIAGLLWKENATDSALIEAIETVIAGRRYFPPDVQTAQRNLRKASDAFYKILSPRELELIPHFGRGLTDDQIGDLFGFSTFTARSHRQRIMGKIGLNRTIDLIQWAMQRGLVPPPSQSRQAIRQVAG